MRLISNVSIVQTEGRKRPTVFVDCVSVSGVLDARYNVGDPGERPTLTITVIAPRLAHGKPRVRRKCGSRPHVPASGGTVTRAVEVLVGESQSDDVLTRAVAERLRGLVRRP